MITILFASYGHRKLNRVLWCLDQHQLRYHVYRGQWRGFGTKLNAAYQATLDFPEEKHILFIDAYDVVVTAGEGKILERFRELDHPWVCSTEPFIWPQGSFAPEQYPPKDPPNTNWPYINSGAYLAERDYLQSCFERWKAQDGEIPYGCEDQPYLFGHWLKEPGVFKLDMGCRLFQSLIGGWWAFEIPGLWKFHNKQVDSWPLILHHNGGGDIEDNNVRPVWDQNWWKGKAGGGQK